MAISCDAASPPRPARHGPTTSPRPHRNGATPFLRCRQQGNRLYDWLRIDPGVHSHPLLVRRSISSGELAYYTVHTTKPVPLAELVRVVGTRWGVGGNLPVRQERDRTGSLPGPPLRRLVPAHHPVRARRRVPHRHRPPRTHPSPKRCVENDPNELIPLSCHEIRRQRATETRPMHPGTHTDHWSDWRGLHQTRARRGHYQRQQLKYNTPRLWYQGQHSHSYSRPVTNDQGRRREIASKARKRFSALGSEQHTNHDHRSAT